jgi:hypothetical protein
VIAGYFFNTSKVPCFVSKAAFFTASAPASIFSLTISLAAPAFLHGGVNCIRYLTLAASIEAFYLSFVASTVDEVLVLAEVSVLVEAGAPESVAAGAAGAAGWEVILS